MERRKWEDMEMDCLVNIFAKVGMESLVFDVPFVCKNWFKATLNPLCWQSLTTFPKFLFMSRFADKYVSFDSQELTVLIKGAVHRSRRCVTHLALPHYFSNEKLLAYVSKECPSLKFLSIPNEVFHLASFISKWKNLETLEIVVRSNLKEVIVQIDLHCKNFVALHLERTTISSDSANAIVTLLPNLKQLVLFDCVLDRSDLVVSLKGCKKLQHLDLWHCEGFNSDNEEILKLASRVTTIVNFGSYDPSLDNDDEFVPLDYYDFDNGADYSSDYSL